MLERIDISPSQSLASTRLTPTAGCRDPPTAKAQGVPGWSRCGKTRDVMNVVCSLLCRGLVAELLAFPRWCPDSSWCEVWSFRCCSVDCHMCLFIILKVTNAVLSACRKQRMNVTCRPMFKRARSYTTRYQHCFFWFVVVVFCGKGMQLSTFVIFIKQWKA